MICALSLLILRVTMKQLVRVMTESLNVGVSTDIQEKIVRYLQVWIPIMDENQYKIYGFLPQYRVFIKNGTVNVNIFSQKISISMN